MTNNPIRSRLRYLFSIVIFLGPTVATLIYVAAAIASANIESRTMKMSKNPYGNEVNGIAVYENLPIEREGWEDLAIFLCPLH